MAAEGGTCIIAFLLCGTCAIMCCTFVDAHCKYKAGETNQTQSQASIGAETAYASQRPMTADPATHATSSRTSLGAEPVALGHADVADDEVIAGPPPVHFPPPAYKERDC